MKDSAILATNTLSIPLLHLRGALRKPEQLLGLRFLSPVSRVQLVEAVDHDNTDHDIKTRALAFVGAIDCLLLPVKSSP